ncbi:MAG TPA: tail fiber protein [Pyrinomonadaceae bacterium]|nr:tail fiber protein [Pyrinomonadaceae bacterium]
MSTPFMGEIKIVSFNFAPKGWAQCNGQFLPINQNQALFSLLGTQFGGNGQTTFALPDFRSRIPIHMGSGFIIGQNGGQESHTVTQAEMPAHTHLLQANKLGADVNVLSGNLFGQVSGGIYGNPSNLTTILPSTITNIGGSQPHENRQPFLVLCFVIALQGIFPSQN